MRTHTNSLDTLVDTHTCHGGAHGHAGLSVVGVDRDLGHGRNLHPGEGDGGGGHGRVGARGHGEGVLRPDEGRVHALGRTTQTAGQQHNTGAGGGGTCGLGAPHQCSS